MRRLLYALTAAIAAALLLTIPSSRAIAQNIGGGLIRVNGAVYAYLGNGTAPAPSATFASDPDTGLFRPAANQLGIAANGSNYALFASGELRMGSASQIGWSSATEAKDGNADTLLCRGGANIVGLGGCTSSFPAIKRNGNGFQLRLADDSNYTDATGLDFRAANRQITQGAGTGITVNDNGVLAQQTYKVTIASTAFICAALTCDVTIGTLPAKTFVSHTLADLTTTFACAAVCTTATLSATLGKTAGGNQYLLSFDADAATGQFGDAAAELGASTAPATTPTEVGDLAAWSATTAVVLRLTSGTGNIGTGAASNLSQGSATFYLTTTRMP